VTASALPLWMEKRRNGVGQSQNHSAIPSRDDSDIASRNHLLESLRQRLLEPGATAVLPEALHGMGGIGESQTIATTDCPEVATSSLQVRADLLLATRERREVLRDLLEAEDRFRALGCDREATCWWTIIKIDSIRLGGFRLSGADVGQLEDLVPDPRDRRLLCSSTKSGESRGSACESCRAVPASSTAFSTPNPEAPQVGGSIRRTAYIPHKWQRCVVCLRFASRFLSRLTGDARPRASKERAETETDGMWLDQVYSLYRPDGPATPHEVVPSGEDAELVITFVAVGREPSFCGSDGLSG
jgi:hypothetical protein